MTAGNASGGRPFEIAPHVLRGYAFIADGERGAVIGPRGELAWMCFPGWADPPLFASLLGGPGAYLVQPTGRFVWGGHYEPGSLIWRNRWIVGDAVVECREMLAFPGRPDAAVLVRRIVTEQRPVEFDAVLDVGDGADDITRLDDRVWALHRGDVHLRWSTVPGVTVDDGRLRTRVRVPPGRHVDLVLEASCTPFDEPPPPPDEIVATTVRAWDEAVPPLERSAAPRDARHAIAVLRGMTAGTGGMVAAATTSMPERATEGRNYDYRYAWIRDQCYAGHAAARAPDAAGALLDAAVGFVTERMLSDGPDLRPAYRVDGSPVPAPSPLDFAGYPGASTVRAGNQARDQFQLDAFGEALGLFAAAAHHDRMRSDTWKAAIVAAAVIEDRWNEPDSGVWELEPRRYTHSRLACVAGLRAAAAVAPDGPHRSRWLALADEITATVTRTSLHPSGRWQRTPEDPRVDASLLLGAVRGAIPPDDPRSRQTLQAVRAELDSDGYVFRYRAGDEPLGMAEGAFLLCGYWTSLALHQTGAHAAAIRYFERHRSACGPPGLFSEEFDPEQRQLRGNLPQAFVHALLLETALALEEVGT